MAAKLKKLPRFHAKTRAEWRRWLEKHHLATDGGWLVSYKKATGKPHLTYDEIAEELLCFGGTKRPGESMATLSDTQAFVAHVHPERCADSAGMC